MIPEGWTIRRFAEIADYKAGRTPTRATAEYWKRDDDGIPWVSISDMTEFGVVCHPKERISKEAFEQVFGGKAVPAGTLLMSFKLTIGRVATLGIDACHNEAIISIFPCESTDQRYLTYFLSQVDYEALQDRQIRGNTLNRDKIDRIQVLLPPYREQLIVADVLDLVRHSISLQNQILTATQDLKRAAMRTLFTHGLRGETQKETEVGPLPESWELASIGNVFEIEQGLSLKGNLANDDKGTPFLRTSNVYWGRIELRTVSQMYIDGDVPSRKLLRRGDLLVCEGGEIGRAAVWNAEIDGCIFQNHIHRLRPLDISRTHVRFTMAWLEEGFQHRNAYDGVGNRTTIPNLSCARLAELLIPHPPFDEQREIVSILNAIDRKIDLHRRKRTVLDDLFKVLLHKLMTGDIRVADLDISLFGKAVGK